MTLEEFVKLEAKQIRRDKELMQLFVNFYEAAFFNLPKCVGCSFNKAFKKLKKYAERSEKNSIFDKNIQEMTAKTFTVKKQYLSKILTYKKDGVTHRKYGNSLTEEFAIALVENGKSEYFSKLPEKIQTEDETYPTLEFQGLIKQANDHLEATKKSIEYYSELNYRKELVPLYNSLSEKLKKEAKSRSKEDIIAFLLENEN